MRPYEKPNRMFRNKSFEFEIKGSVDNTKTNSTLENLISKEENRAEEDSQKDGEVKR
jgi:hypothetical protein